MDGQKTHPQCVRHSQNPEVGCFNETHHKHIITMTITNTTATIHTHTHTHTHTHRMNLSRECVSSKEMHSRM